MKKIVLAGTMLVDHIREMERLPARGELARVHRTFDAVGGCVCNTGIDLAILDPTLSVEALGRVGADGDGDLILKRLQEHGIRTDRILRCGQTSFTDVLAETACHTRTFCTFGGACDAFCADDPGLQELDCDLFHLGYLLLLPSLDAPDAQYGTKAAALLHHIREQGIATSVDLVSENSDRFSSVVSPALKYTDYAVINEVEAGKTVGLELRDGSSRLIPGAIREALIRMRRLGVRKWAVIHAPEGAFGMDESGNDAQEPSKTLPKGYIKGTTGAGDAFCAGVLLAALHGKDLTEALVWGNASAQMSLWEDTATGGMTDLQSALQCYRAFSR